MTITGPRQQYIHFSEPYNYIDAQFAASKASGITTIAGLKGKTICVGEATTYQEWIQGLLNLGTYQPKLPPPSRKFTTQSSDIGCAEAWQAGRNDAQGWLTASYTIDQAIKQGLPVVKLGQPVWAAPLAVAAIKSGPNPTTMIALVNKVLTGLYNSGQLGKWCEKWFGFNSTIPVKN
jgi:ABC-type amino acid transport substrate-binding protein